MTDFVQTGPFSRKAAEKVERLPGQLLQALGLGKLGETTKYLSSVKASQDFTNLLRGQLPSVGAAPIGPDPLEGDPTGRYAPGFMQQPFRVPAAPILPPPGTNTTVVSGTLDGVTPDRTQSDEYKAQLAQYGALQKAKKFEEADKLGMEIWRSKYKDTPMAQEKGAVGAFNPLMKRTFPEQYGEPTMGPTPAALQADPALKGVTSFFPGAEPGGFTPGVGNPVTPTEAFNQGEVMDANRGVQNLQVWQRAKTNPQNYTSQQSFDPDTLARVSNFLSRY